MIGPDSIARNRVVALKGSLVSQIIASQISCLLQRLSFFPRLVLAMSAAKASRGLSLLVSRLYSFQGCPPLCRNISITSPSTEPSLISFCCQHILALHRPTQFSSLFPIVQCLPVAATPASLAFKNLKLVKHYVLHLWESSIPPLVL